METCNIYSFEPFSKNRGRLNKNIELNYLSNCHIMDMAISDKAGVNRIYYAGNNNSGSSSLVPKFGNDCEYENVKCVTFDEFAEPMELNLNSINMFKIDVEGFELNVLKGMDKFLDKYNCIVFLEHNMKHLRLTMSK